MRRIKITALAGVIFGFLASAPLWLTGATGTQTWLNPKDGQTYVRIPAGTFEMGCSPGDSACANDEKPAHQVTISKAFWMGQTDVTVAAYHRVKGPTRAKLPPDLPALIMDVDDARSYCSKVGLRFPTEAEWEYAARAGATGPYYAPPTEIAWFLDDSGGEQIEPVGRKRPNAFGLYDMLGDVGQWVSDVYGPYKAKSQKDPKGPRFVFGPLFYVVRGGSATSIMADVRVSSRGLKPTSGADRLPGPSYIGLAGFRCAGN